MFARLRNSSDKKDPGFTLIELLVVIIIIGILAAIAIPVFLTQRQKGWDAQAKSDLKNMANAQETYLTDGGAYRAEVVTTTSALGMVGFEPSADTTNHLATAVGSYSYCLSVSSKSGQIWVYDSSAGAAEKSAAASCPAT